MPSEAAPAATVGEEFLRHSRRDLRSRFDRIEKCVERLSDEQVWQRQHEIENAVGNLLLHLAGNVRQWIISGVGGAADARVRDAEFAQREPIAKEDALAKLRDTLAEADGVLDRLSESELLTERRIQVYDVSVLQAVSHVCGHFAEHTGQIIWATKRFTGEDLGFYGYLKGGGKPPEKAAP